MFAKIQTKINEHQEYVSQLHIFNRTIVGKYFYKEIIFVKLRHKSKFGKYIVDLILSLGVNLGADQKKMGADQKVKV